MEGCETVDEFFIGRQFFYRIAAPVAEQISVCNFNLKKHALVNKNIQLIWISTRIRTLSKINQEDKYV
jgi:hypothetical protein